MKSDELLDAIRNLEPWFHDIALSDGVSTKTTSVAGEPVDHPRETWERVSRHLPLDLTGKSVLDVGCNAGFYSIRAKERNASRVVGLDANRLAIRQARFVRRSLGLDIEYQRLSVYAINPFTLGQFDVVLALGLIYHCRHVVLALEKLYQVTRELLILESTVLSPSMTPDWGATRFGHNQATLHPMAWVGNRPSVVESVCNWFIPGSDSLCQMLIHVGFDHVEITELFADRAVITACKVSPHLPSTDPSGLSARLVPARGPERCYPGAHLEYVLSISNRGRAQWSAGRSGRGTVFLGAHLLDDEEEVLVWDWGRTPLASPLDPGDEIELVIRMVAPAEPSVYVVEFDMVSQSVAWFEDCGSPTAQLELVVSDHGHDGQRSL